MDLAEPQVIVPLSQYLTMGCLFRLRRALPKGSLDEDTLLQLLKTKISNKSFQRMHTASEWSAKLSIIANRCRECGQITQCNLRVCRHCSRDVGGYYAMVTRRNVHDRYSHTHPSQTQRLRMMSALKVAKYSQVGAYLYWERDMIQVFL